MDRKEDFPEIFPPPLLDEEEEEEVETQYENPNFYNEHEIREEEETASQIINFFQDLKNQKLDDFGGATNSAQDMQGTQSYSISAETGKTEGEQGRQYEYIKDSLMGYSGLETEYSEVVGEEDCEYLEFPVMEEEDCEFIEFPVMDEEYCQLEDDKEYCPLEEEECDFSDPPVLDDDCEMVQIDVSTSCPSDETSDCPDEPPSPYRISRTTQYHKSRKNTPKISKVSVKTSCPETFPIPSLNCYCPQNQYHQYHLPSNRSHDSKFDCQSQQTHLEHPHKRHKMPPKPTIPNDSCNLNCENCCQDPCHADRPPWDISAPGKPGTDDGWCHCQSNLIKLRLDQFLEDYNREKVDPCFQPTQIIVDDKGYLLERPKQKRPLWGMPVNQWDIDATNGRRPYRQLFSGPPKTPLPTFFQPLASSIVETCKQEDKDFVNRENPFPILHCCDCPCCDCFEDCCPRKWSRGTHRDYRGIRPKGTPFTEEPPTQEDPLIKMLMQQTQVVFNEFLLKKIPIIWIYGRPQKSVAAVRRNYCLSLAETHGFTYISLDEEIAILAAKGSRAIRAGNPFFEGFSAVERLAIPVCIKLATDPKYSLDRFEAMEMLKFLMLQYFPTKGYIIDGFPWDSIDNEDFERIFYPITCGLYFLDANWTTNKAEPPEVIPPLYFRRSQEYDENEVEEACGNFGLKTLKIIGAEQLLDDEEKIFALHAILDEYLDAYDEVLEGNEDVLRDNNLEFQTFGETVGYGVDLAEYMKRKQEADQEAAANAMEPQRHFIELETLKALGWKGDEDLSKFSSTLFDLDNLKVVPSQRMMPPEEEDEEGKGKHKKRKHRKHRHRRDSDESIVCVDGEPCPEKRRKHHRGHGRKHRCKCRCRCRHDRHKRGGRGSEDYGGGDNDDGEDFPAKQGTGHSSRPRKGRRGSDYDDDNGSELPEDHAGHRTESKPVTKIGGRRPGTKRGKPKESESEMDQDMDPSGPFTTDKRWGFRSTKRLGKHPTVHIPRLSTSHRKTDLTKREDEIDQITREGTAVYALPSLQTHGIPDPYNTLPHKSGQKPGDYLQDFPGPSAPDRFSKINRTETQPENAPGATTAYTPEPTSGLKSLFSDNMSRILAKNQADIRKIKYDKLKQKVGQVEYEIYQDDYRSPKYRFYKKYQDNTPEDLVREKENNVPCANCFDSFKQADQFNKGEKVKNLSHLKHERNEAKEEKAHQYGKGPLFNRIISCLCGEDNEAGFTIPGYKPEPKLEDNTDLDQIDGTPDYRKKKE